MDERFLRDEALRLRQAARREKSPSMRRMLESHAVFYAVIASESRKQKLASKHRPVR